MDAMEFGFSYYDGPIRIKQVNNVEYNSPA